MKARIGATKSWNPRRLDVAAFCAQAAELEQTTPLAEFQRLLEEEVAPSETPVDWQLQGEQRSAARAGQAAEPWLLVSAQARLWLRCQRCLEPVQEALEVNRWFRFVANEDRAAAEDEDCEEDVLALEPKPDLLALIEDELLMELPVVPLHTVCPATLPQHSGDLGHPDHPGVGAPDGGGPRDADGGAATTHHKPTPFAALAALKKKPQPR